MPSTRPCSCKEPSGCRRLASEQYWSASKCRLDRWRRLLTQLTAASEPAREAGDARLAAGAPVLEEILTSELLTRIWTAAAAAYDAARSDQDLEPIARNIYSGHLDVRRRLLGLMADGRSLTGNGSARPSTSSAAASSGGATCCWPTWPT